MSIGLEPVNYVVSPRGTEPDYRTMEELKAEVDALRKGRAVLSEALTWAMGRINALEGRP